MSNDRLEFAIQAVRAAAKSIRKFALHKDDIRIKYKTPNDPVSNADLAAERTVLEMLAERYPHDGVLSEEAGASGNQDSCWVLDPIDGTNNFINGLPAYAVSLAWCKDGKPAIGVILDVPRDAIYTASTGKGAFCDQRRIKVAPLSQMHHALIGSTGSPKTNTWQWDALAEASKKSAGFRRVGAATLDFAYTAKGALAASFGSNLSYWDYAAGSVIIKEAGGIFTDLDGNTEVAFGAKLQLCIFGAERIVGNLRRLCTKHHAQREQP